jgi:hypothetical protein
LELFQIHRKVAENTESSSVLLTQIPLRFTSYTTLASWSPGTGKNLTDFSNINLLLHFFSHLSSIHPCFRSKLLKPVQRQGRLLGSTKDHLLEGRQFPQIIWNYSMRKIFLFLLFFLHLFLAIWTHIFIVLRIYLFLLLLLKVF